jgi:hypothetical protein
MTMLTEKFDAYGDVLPDVARDERETGAEKECLGP